MLQLNSINPFVFADAMRDLLAHGRGKFHNVLIVDPAIRGKTFLLKSLEGGGGGGGGPTDNKYAWFGADQPKVIVLQDSRWRSELIFLKDLLLYLE